MYIHAVVYSPIALYTYVHTLYIFIIYLFYHMYVRNSQLASYVDI